MLISILILTSLTILSNSVGNSDQATSGESKHSASEPLRTVPQIAEHQTNCQDPAHQLDSSPTKPSIFSKQFLTGLQQDIPCSDDKELHNTEEGEIQQQIFPSSSIAYNPTAANTNLSPIIMPSTTFLTKGAIDDHTYNSNNNIQYNNHLQSYHAKNSAHDDEPNLLTFNHYNSKDTPISLNTQTNSPLYLDQSPTMTSPPTANPYN